jgi:hypothetical protein
MTPVAWQRAEGTVIAAAAFVGVLLLGFPFWLPIALFLAFDLSALGYLVNPRVGAWGYNLVHNYAGAAIVGVIAAVTATPWVGVVALSWAFHVAADRALGYGLKHPDHFQHTHLGWIGKREASPQ